MSQIDAKGNSNVCFMFLLGKPNYLNQNLLEDH